MRVLYDPETEKLFRQEWNLCEIFEDPEIPFRFCSYREGESLLVKHPLDRYIKFILQGVFRIYSITPDGKEYVVFQGQKQELMTKWHIGPEYYQLVYVEAVTPVITAELLLDQWEDVLMNDAKFMKFLLEQVSSSFREFALGIILQEGTVEKRLLSLPRNSCGNSFSGVDEMAKRLHCSRSQLQKALRGLITDGKIQRMKKGCYQLIE